jgi:hypothetical protein
VYFKPILLISEVAKFISSFKKVSSLFLIFGFKNLFVKSSELLSFHMYLFSFLLIISFGAYTCYKPAGCSVVDYAIVSQHLLCQILYMQISNFYAGMSDCHCKLSFKILASYQRILNWFEIHMSNNSVPLMSICESWLDLLPTAVSITYWLSLRSDCHCKLSFKILASYQREIINRKRKDFPNRYIWNNESLKIPKG